VLSLARTAILVVRANDNATILRLSLCSIDPHHFQESDYPRILILLLSRSETRTVPSCKLKSLTPSAATRWAPDRKLTVLRSHSPKKDNSPGGKNTVESWSVDPTSHISARLLSASRSCSKSLGVARKTSPAPRSSCCSTRNTA
jgi:hypothetical protein